VVPRGFAIPLFFESVVLDRAGLGRRLSRQVGENKGSLLRMLLEVQGPRCEVRIAGEYAESATTAEMERLNRWMGHSLKRMAWYPDPEPSFQRRCRNARGQNSSLRELQTGQLAHVGDRVHEVLGVLWKHGRAYVDELSLDSSSDGGSVHSSLRLRFEVSSLSVDARARLYEKLREVRHPHTKAKIFWVAGPKMPAELRHLDDRRPTVKKRR
jgi:hypothetical protein